LTEPTVAWLLAESSIAGARLLAQPTCLPESRLTCLPEPRLT
jgi:hypothetical protein